MKHVERSALLPYTPSQMFAVVNDVQSYSAFLPWCDASEVLEENDKEMVARLSIARAGLRQSFTTRNRLAPPAEIRMNLVDGPFSSLCGRWTFSAMGDDGCKIEMHLSFDFNNSLIDAALSKVFESAIDTLVDAFCERADTLYSAS